MKMAQTDFKKNHLARRFAQIQILGFFYLAFVAGCADSAGTPVNMNVAQEIMETAMEGWKNGRTPSDLLDEKPSIFVQEAEWNDETKLVDYEIVKNDEPAGPNLIATVKLKLSKAEGKVIEKTATYVVGTSPRLTIYRNLMR